jgi:raffinose/stachyose/melibiose transport system permease protein
VLFFMPVVLTPLIISFLWKYIFSTHGPLNMLLAVAGLDGLQQSWLGEPMPAMVSILVAASWQSAGLAMVIYLAGLQGIPAEMMEAARIDGANRWQVFRFITLPMLAPALTVTIVNSLITSLKLFDQIYVLTGGGPRVCDRDDVDPHLQDRLHVRRNRITGRPYSVVFTFVVGAVVLTMLHVLRKREIDHG